MRTQEKDLLSMLNFSSSSCGALQLINTNKHNFVNFLSVYSKDNAFSNSVSSVTFHPLDYFSLFFGSSFAIKCKKQFFIRFALDYKHYPPLVLIHIIYFPLPLFSAKHPPMFFVQLVCIPHDMKQAKPSTLYKCILISVLTIFFLHCESALNSLYLCAFSRRSLKIRFPKGEFLMSGKWGRILSTKSACNGPFVTISVL